MTSNRQSTPPNQGEPPTGPRQSSRLRTPLARPGFVPTHTDSRRTLVVNSVPTTGSEPIVSHPKNPRKDKNQPESQAAGATSLTSGTAGPNEFNIIQDSDDKNEKANKRGKNIKGGFDHPKKFFFEGSTAEGQKQFQDPSSTTKPDFFPMLDTIEELDEDAAEDEQSVEGTNEIQEVDECDDCGEVDPDDASIGSDCDLSDVNQGQACMEGSIVDGFGHTLVKVC
ncbi:hypothetical protein PtA15_11A197 [Puccinia triticina]|uniref:Uncharacterized protein n=1 Tax=Puccinia triticina TaxID=208348 RepID=A0ABY7CX57_9BASI|nr:uncharacterized protein PtA15_11A197 [Puccinia triticina]WAQ89508.1 hypothetical protein PtA15_11A197 [Puccinia triticina]